MSSGLKHLQNNTRERLISTDFNRMQNFSAADSAETLRCMLNDQYVRRLSAGRVFRQSALGTPLSGDVIGGLMVVPQIGGTSITIEPGKLGCYFPDAVPSTDDSQYKVITSDGIAGLGVLVIAANAGAGIRIDVIECSPFEFVDESDNRNIFDPGTGTFAAALVDKVVSTRLNFRVRQGVPGAGYPGHEAGWLPLAIASVPVGSVNNDTVTFWDVRPLVADRVNGPYNAYGVIPEFTRSLLYADTSAACRVYGNFESSYDAYKIGGPVYKTTPTTVMGTGDLEYIDLNSAENYAVGYVVINAKPWYLYVMLPYGLPRWCRYTETNFMGLGRVPSTFRGIAVLSNQECYYTGDPIMPIQLPAITGLTAATDIGTVIASGTSAGGVHLPFMSNGRMTYLPFNVAGITITPTASALTTDDYSLISGDHYPANARSIRVLIYTQYTEAAGTWFSIDRTVSVYRFMGAQVVATVNAGGIAGTMSAGGDFTDFFEVTIPLIPALPNTALTTRNIQVVFTGAGFTGRTGILSFIRVIGWELGP